jgi:hypothetical protein
MRGSVSDARGVADNALVKATYVKVLLVQAIVLAGLWLLQRAFL